MPEFFTFGLSHSSTETSPEVLGGKGAGLVWMHQQGVPVPPGFVIPTTVWAEYDKKPKTVMKEIAKTLPFYLEQLRQHFGFMPLVSVRSGARVSCPGMMDTILNVGIDDETEDLWLERLGAECFANTLHRLVIMYGSVVAGIKREDLDPNLKTALHEYTRQTGEEFPKAQAQLLGAIEAVFKSWDNDRANVYRKLNDIPREWGTAVTVQAMVFGNMNDKSGTGVLFTRNPDTGECKVTGEFLPNAQGEDVVAGIRTPVPLEQMAEWNKTAHDELIHWVTQLEKLRQDVQDVEFTVQDGVLYILQTRNAKRSATAAIRIALDMAKEGLINKKTAVRRVTPKQFDMAQAAHIDPKWKKTAAFTGIPACSGVVTGKPVFDKDAAINCKESCILITHETTPDDIAGMYAAKGVITMNGGLTSHAAVVARSMNRTCIVGVGQTVESFKDVEVISMDGATGQIWAEPVPIIEGETNGLIKEYTALVFDALGALPVIMGVPPMPLEQALLYLGDRLLHTSEAANIVIDVAEKVKTLYLDLTPLPKTPEAEFFEMVQKHDPVGKLVTQLEGLVWMHKNLQKQLVLLGATSGVFQTMGSMGDLRSLVLADKQILFDAAVAADPAIQKVVEWKKAEGVECVLLGQYVEGSKSMISVQQALQLVQGGA